MDKGPAFEDYPKGMGWTYFIAGDVVFIKENSVVVGFRVRPWKSHVERMRRLGYTPNLGLEDGLGPLRGCKELFAKCYRTLVCRSCRMEKLANKFDWKKRGAEGPFPQVWGKRDSFCKDCRSSQKAASYAARRQKRETLKGRSTSATWDVNECTLDVSFTPYGSCDMSVIPDLIERLVIG